MRAREPKIARHASDGRHAFGSRIVAELHLPCQPPVMHRRRHGPVPKIIAAAIGLPLWLVTQFLALLMSGAGHGWTAPFFFSLPLLLLYPLVSLRAFCWSPAAKEIDVVILVAAAALDLFLLGDTLTAEPEYFLKVWNSAGGLVAAWIGLWAGWQVLAVATLLRRRRG